MYIISRIYKAENETDKQCSLDPLHPPRRIHWRLEDAKKEAARLAAKHPGMQFIVFQGTDAVLCPVAPVQWLKL